jgi:hypothetical protein
VSNVDLSMNAGDTPTVTIAVTDAVTGAPKDITGATVIFAAAHGYRDVSPLFTVTQATHTNPTGGLSALVLLSSSTDSLPIPSVLVYEIIVNFASGDIETVQYGKLTVL